LLNIGDCVRDFTYFFTFLIRDRHFYYLVLLQVIKIRTVLRKGIYAKQEQCRDKRSFHVKKICYCNLRILKVAANTKDRKQMVLMWEARQYRLFPAKKKTAF
jgi:hypothetical protein